MVPFSYPGGGIDYGINQNGFTTIGYDFFNFGAGSSMIKTKTVTNGFE
ncbi:hypothetical protein VXM60_17030 [Shewanella khirikhana]